MTGQALAPANAHSYIFQTLADLGIVGLLLSLALAGAWVRAALRSTGLRRPRAPGGDAAERIGLVTMLAVVVVFVVHSAIDWTWFVPADAVLALLLAGWVAGRSRLWRRRRRSCRGAPGWCRDARGSPPPAPSRRSRSPPSPPGRSGSRCAPPTLRTRRRSRSATPSSTPRPATAPAPRASTRPPAPTPSPRSRATRWSITGLQQLGAYYTAVGNDPAARATYEREVALQPSNSQSWWDLAFYESGLGTRTGDCAAYRAYATALYLQPQNLLLQREFLSLARCRA